MFSDLGIGVSNSEGPLLVSTRKPDALPALSSATPESDVRRNRPRLLWIDDEISESAPEVRFLRVQGFEVDCAVTGCRGLEMARAGPYDGILLDLKLPDLPGLSILATLRAEENATPVLVLTGFADLEAARVAGRFGASGFKAKPLFVDDLEVAVKRLIENLGSDSAIIETAGTEEDQLRAGFAALAALLERLHRLSRKGSATTDPLNGSSASRAVTLELVRALSNSALPMIAFLACCKALRSSFENAESLGTLGADTEALILEALAKPGLVDPRVAAAIEDVRKGAAQHKRPTIEAIADGQHLSGPHLGRRIKEETGFDFTDWRTAFILRPAVTALLETHQDVKQIACGSLGFKHLSQFDHEFHRFFGLTPTEFRQFRR